MRISDWSSDVCSSDLAVPGLVEALAGAGARPADEGRRLPAAVEGIAPGVVGAADEAPGAARLRHQPQTAMAAGVVEDAPRAVMVTQQEHRQGRAQPRTGLARLRHSSAERRVRTASGSK